MHWKRRSWMLVGLLLVAWTADAAAQVTTTQIADTVYHANGTAATGTVLISWAAFTTSSGTSIPGGNVSTTITTGGALSVHLIPNAGVNPVGTYYTVVYHLDDGTVSRQYWVVPASVTAVHISAIESSVVPISVAMQTVSKSYVDTAIAAALAALSGGGGGSSGVQLGGDLSGTITVPIVAGLRGHPISAAAPAAGQTLMWSGSAYVPTTPSGGSTHTITLEHSFSGAGTFNYEHSLGSLYPLMTCYVNSGSSAFTAANVDANNIAITVTASSDITCTFGI
jgi:hypothetical protein